MSHALAELWSTVDKASREDFLRRARERRSAVEAAGAHYWVFERHQTPERMVEFVEAPSPEILAQARAALGRTPHDEEILLDQLEF